MIGAANVADDLGMNQIPAFISIGAVSMSVSGDQLVITHRGKAGTMQVNVAAARLERWARGILREEAFAADPAPKVPEGAREVQA